MVTSSSLRMRLLNNVERAGQMTSSSETQGQLVGAGKSLNGRGKKSGEEKSRTKIGAPGILLLTDQFRNHLKSLPVIGHKNIRVQLFSCYFRDFLFEGVHRQTL